MLLTSTKWSAEVLASEGFAAVEELAYVDLDEISSIDGFDEEPPRKSSNRAREYLERLPEAEMDEKRKALGVSDELRMINGMTAADDGRPRRGRHQDDQKTLPVVLPTISSAGLNARRRDTKKLTKACSPSSKCPRRGRSRWSCRPACWLAGSPKPISPLEAEGHGG